MSLSAVDPTVSAMVLLITGIILLLVAWIARLSRTRARPRSNPREALLQAERLRQSGHFREASALLATAAEAMPNDSAIHYRLACCHSLLRDFRGAIVHLKRACDLDSNWAVSAMHDPDLRPLWESGTAGSRPSQWLAPRSQTSKRAA